MMSFCWGQGFVYISKKKKSSLGKSCKINKKIKKTKSSLFLQALSILLFSFHLLISYSLHDGRAYVWRTAGSPAPGAASGTQWMNTAARTELHTRSSVYPLVTSTSQSLIVTVLRWCLSCSLFSYPLSDSSGNRHWGNRSVFSCQKGTLLVGLNVNWLTTKSWMLTSSLIPCFMICLQALNKSAQSSIQFRDWLIQFLLIRGFILLRIDRRGLMKQYKSSGWILIRNSNYTIWLYFCFISLTLIFCLKYGL